MKVNNSISSVRRLITLRDRYIRATRGKDRARKRERSGTVISNWIGRAGPARSIGRRIPFEFRASSATTRETKTDVFFRTFRPTNRSNRRRENNFYCSFASSQVRPAEKNKIARFTHRIVVTKTTIASLLYSGRTFSEAATYDRSLFLAATRKKTAQR